MGDQVVGIIGTGGSDTFPASTLILGVAQYPAQQVIAAAGPELTVEMQGIQVSAQVIGVGLAVSIAGIGGFDPFTGGVDEGLSK